jgi:hypothetical protein
MIVITKYKNIKNRRNLKYPSTPSSMAPVPHSDDLPIPNSPEHSSYEEERDRTSDPNESLSDEEIENGPHFLNQEELDDLIRQLQLPKSKAEFLASRLKEWRFLLPSCKISKYRTRHEEFSPFFQTEDSLCYCSDISGLFKAIGFPHHP